MVLLTCLSVALSLVLLGCGSVNSSDYSGEVSDIYKHASEELKHIFEELGPGDSEGEDGAEETLITSLEEAAEAAHKSYEELEKVKVPEGLEDLHRESLALFQSVALSYEELAAFLEAEEHHEEEAHEESHDEEEHEEEHAETGEQEEHETDQEHKEENNQGH